VVRHRSVDHGANSFPYARRRLQLRNGDQYGPQGNFWATDAGRATMSTPAVLPMPRWHPARIATAGSSQPHENMQPYLVLNFIIAMQGISRREARDRKTRIERGVIQ